jgi:hypothetical protein
MLRVKSATGEIKVRFDHRFCDPSEIEGITGIWVDGDRRCSLATVSLNEHIVGRGMAVCHPGDNFCRSTGRKRALADAVFPLDYAVRKAIWDEYLETCNS